MTSADATGLDLDELQREVARFGVAEEQVRRDHLISHVLAAISASCSEDVIFFGGTALSRTHLAHSRLSEDIDLIATTTRGVVLPKLVRAVERALLRTHGRTVWSPGRRTEGHRRTLASRAHGAQRLGGVEDLADPARPAGSDLPAGAGAHRRLPTRSRPCTAATGRGRHPHLQERARPRPQA